MTDPELKRGAALERDGINISSSNSFTAINDNHIYKAVENNGCYMCNYCIMAQCEQWSKIELCKGTHFFISRKKS